MHQEYSFDEERTTSAQDPQTQQTRSSVGRRSNVDTSGVAQNDSPTFNRIDAASAVSILRRLFSASPRCVGFRLWDGTEFCCGDGSVPVYTLVFHNPRIIADTILTNNPLHLADAYFRGGLDIEGDFYQALNVRHYLPTVKLTLWEKCQFVVKALSLKLLTTASGQPLTSLWHKRWRQLLGRRSDRELNKEAISFHYDVSNDFYKLWLDQRMVYSCAYYDSSNQSLEQAQCNKLDHICRKLRLQPGERLLDIGCGWGALICRAAEQFGVYADGITLSGQQHEYVQQLIKERGLAGKVTVRLLDYRDLPDEAVYDKVVSVGMFEHVGLKNLPTYFAVANKQLKPGGLFLNHGITSKEGGWKKGLSRTFINRYVFPDGQLESVSAVQQVMEDADFEIHDVECLRIHYALTLREWVKRLEQHREQALRYVSESTYRVWRLYMAACAQQFEEGTTGLYQILISKRKPFCWPVPLTRQDLYRD